MALTQDTALPCAEDTRDPWGLCQHSGVFSHSAGASDELPVVDGATLSVQGCHWKCSWRGVVWLCAMELGKDPMAQCAVDGLWVARAVTPCLSLSRPVPGRQEAAQQSFLNFKVHTPLGV